MIVPKSKNTLKTKENNVEVIVLLAYSLTMKSTFLTLNFVKLKVYLISIFIFCIFYFQDFVKEIVKIGNINKILIT